MKKFEKLPSQEKPEEIKGEEEQKADVIKEKITEGLDKFQKDTEKDKIAGWEINNILNLLREDGPLADDPDREKLLGRLKDIAPEQVAKIEAHDEEVRARDKERKEGKENPLKQRVVGAISRLEEGNPVSKFDLNRLNSLLRENGPLADDSDREELLNRVKALEEKGII